MSNKNIKEGIEILKKLSPKEERREKGRTDRSGQKQEER